MNKAAIFLAFLCLAAPCAPGPARAAESAAVFVYHRFGESGSPSTNVTLGQFETQIAEIKAGGYAPMALPDMLQALKDGGALPDLAVGFSADDAYRSVFTEAWPRLKAAGIPLTVFVATDAVDQGLSNFMTWDQIRRLAAEGVTIGSHTASHLHMADAPDAVNADEIARANARFMAELGFVPALFAYPYGEMSLAVRDRVKAAGYEFAFGQHSGAVNPGSDFLYLPRFAINEHFGGLDEFRLRARALGFAVRDLEPADPTLTESPAALSFTLTERYAGLEHLACFGADGHPFPVTVNGERVTLTIDRIVPPGRFRVGCTLPAEGGRFRWYGTSYYLPRK